MKLKDEYAMAVFPVITEIMDKYAKKHGITVEPSDVAKTVFDYVDALIEERDGN